MLILDKTENIKLCKGLTSGEFSCKCNAKECRAIIVDQKLINAYAKFRKFINKPLTILSGHRCAVHNYNTSGTAKSRHQAGQAIDVSILNLDHLSVDDIQHAAMKAGFTFFLEYKTFVHLDVR